MLQIKSLNKSCSEKQIFKNFNLELKDTDNLIISGTSGSGKSTLAQIIAGLDDNYEGMVSYKDMTLGHVSQQDWLKHIQYVPQYNANTLDPKKNSFLDLKTTFKTL